MSWQAEAVALLLLDLDETLLDRTSTFRRWANDFSRSCGADEAATLWLIEQDRGGYRPKEEFVRLVYERLAPREPLTVDGFRRSFAGLFRCDPPVPAALSRVRAGGWSIGVVTNGSHVQLEKVAVSGLSGAVDVVCVSEIERCRKPDPHLLQIAASRIGTTLEGAWLVGDNPVVDNGAAAAAGIRSVWLRRGRRWAIEEFRPTAEADDVSRPSASPRLSDNQIEPPERRSTDTARPARDTNRQWVFPRRCRCHRACWDEGGRHGAVRSRVGNDRAFTGPADGHGGDVVPLAGLCVKEPDGIDISVDGTVATVSAWMVGPPPTEGVDGTADAGALPTPSS